MTEPIKPLEVYHPQVITIRNLPRVWVFKCGRCQEKVIKFGWFGYARCYFCGALNGCKWLFYVAGY